MALKRPFNQAVGGNKLGLSNIYRQKNILATQKGRI